MEDTRRIGSVAKTFTQGHGLDGPWGMVSGLACCFVNSIGITRPDIFYYVIVLWIFVGESMLGNGKKIKIKSYTEDQGI